MNIIGHSDKISVERLEYSLSLDTGPYLFQDTFYQC